MRLIRGLLGGLLWVLGGVLGLLGVVLCVTIILLPLGIPLVVAARRLLTRATQLMLPRALAHPINEATKKVSAAGSDAKDVSKTIGKKTRKAARATRKRVA